MKTNTYLSLLSLCALSGSVFGQDGTEGLGLQNYNKPAVFMVTDRVINENVEPFTATIGGVGNVLVNVPFELPQYRTMLTVEEDAPDRILTKPSAISKFDSFREGFYDGAEVRIYRIVNGKFELVRRDRIPEGGTAMSDWLSCFSADKLVPHKANAAAQEYTFRFDGWNRPDAPYWFSVSAIFDDGTESAKSAAAKVHRTSEKAKQQAKATELTRYKPSKGSEGKTAPAAPADVKGEYDAASGSARLTWSAPAAKGVIGYRVYRSDYEPSKHRGYYLQLAGGTPKDAEQYIRKGDLAFIAKPFSSFSRNRYQSNRVWGSSENKAAMPAGIPNFPDEDANLSWELVAHETNSPILPEGGEACGKFTLGPGKKLSFDQYNHGPTGQSWYRVLLPGETYVVEFWARQEGMEKPVGTFKMNGFYGRKVEPMRFEIDSQWRHYKKTFTINELYDAKSGVIGQTSLSFEGPGTLWLDNFRVYLQDTEFLDYTPAEYAALKESGMQTLRTHAFIKTGTKTYSMKQFVQPGGAINGVAKGNTLPQNLKIMRKAGVLPWLQVEFHMSPEEWLGLVEYLAAPYDPKKDTPEAKPWAYERYRQGQQKPWVDEFPKFYFEIGNETWNWLFAPWVFEGMRDSATGKSYNRGQVYGLFQEMVIDCLEKSPYWKSSGLANKMSFVLGGWSIQRYGVHAATTSPRSTFVTRAAYNGGWDEGEGPSEGNDSSLFRAMMQAGQTSLPSAQELCERRNKMKAEGTADFQIGTYEAGPGYALSGLNGQARMSDAEVRAQEETMKSLAVGTTTLDTFLGRAANDYDIQNFFTFYHGRTHWVSHSALSNGGRAYPPWMTLALFNTQGTGDMLAVEAESQPTIDLPAYKRRKASTDVPLVACYATRKADRLNVFVLSRKIDRYPIANDDGFTPVTLKLPIKSAKSVTLYRMVGDPRAHNLDEEKVKIEKIAFPKSLKGSLFPVSDKTGADRRGLPPGATLLYVFEGVK